MGMWYVRSKKDWRFNMKGSATGLYGALVAMEKAIRMCRERLGVDEPADLDCTYERLECASPSMH